MSHVVVIGSGSAGLVAAIGCIQVGYEVTIIEKHRIGGDCTNYGCIPSKSLLSRAHDVFHLTSLLKKVSPDASINPVTALQETRDIVGHFQHEESKEWLEGYGIHVCYGTAEFISKHRIRVSGDQLHVSSQNILDQIVENTVELVFDFCVIATGSRPFIPPIPGLENTPYLTNYTLFQLQAPPKRLGIIGDGPIGIEMAEAFAQLGSEVTVFGRDQEILKRSDPEVAKRLRTYLEHSYQNLNFSNQEVTSIDYKTSFTVFQDKKMMDFDQLLVATGRIPNVGLGLEKAGIEYHPMKGIPVRPSTQTNISNVYAIGDCCQVPKFTHMAGHMGRTAVTNLIVRKYFKLPIVVSRYDRKQVPAVTFTSLELAETGLTQKQAEERYGAKSIRVYTVNMPEQIDRSKTTPHVPGYIKIVTKGVWGTLVGVSILATRAGEMLPEFQHAIEEKKSIRYLNAIIRAYPTYTSGLERLTTQWLKNVIQDIQFWK